MKFRARQRWVDSNRTSSILQFISWPHRLTVRTPGSHPGNRGSIPREITNLRLRVQLGVLNWFSLESNGKQKSLLPRPLARRVNEAKLFFTWRINVDTP